MEVVLPTQGYDIYDVRKFAGGQLQFSFDTITHNNYSTTNWTIGVIFLDDNGYPVHNISDTNKRLSTIDNPDELFNTVILVPHITKDTSTHYNNYNQTINVPFGARQMIWMITSSYYQKNNNANIQIGDKFLLTYRLGLIPSDTYFYQCMYSLKDYTNELTGAVVKNKNQNMYGADYLQNASFVNQPYTTNPNNDRLINRIKSTSDGTIYLMYQSRYPDKHFVSMTNVQVMGSEYINMPPIVSVGDNVTITDNNKVFLEGSAIDPDKDLITYQWTCQNNPNIIINNSTLETADVDINLNMHHTDTPIDLIFQLVATDINNNVSDPGYITVTVNPPLNKMPITEPFLTFIDIDGESTQVFVDEDTIDPDNDPLTYNWVQVSGPEVIITDPTAKDIEVTFPLLQNTTENEAIVEGTITDIGGLSVKRTYKFVINTLQNNPPTVYAGEDQTVDSLFVVTLKGSIIDLEDVNISYQWSQIDGPIVEMRPDPDNDKNIIITTPKIEASVGDTKLTFRLTANDGINPPVHDDVVITVKAAPNSPLNIWDDQVFDVIGGETRLFEDLISNDPDGDELIYKWRQIKGPTLEIDDVNARNINITFPTIGYNKPNLAIIEAIITDGIDNETLRYTFNIQTEANQAPIITRKIDPDSQVFENTGEVITRSIEAYDPDGQLLNYSWSLLTSDLYVDGLIEPWFGNIVFTPNSKQLKFTMPDLEPANNTQLKLLFQVIVDDGELFSNPETYEIIINAPIPEINDGNIYYDNIEDAIIVDGKLNPVSLSDIKTAIDDQLGINQTICQSVNDQMFLISSNVIIKNGSYVKDKNISLTVLGLKFIIDKTSSFQLGTLTDLDTTIDGCYFSMPNIPELVGRDYAFGGGDYLNSGNLYLYGCRINVWSFWGFFRGDDQEVHILDCVIRGYGRISGLTSRIRNLTFEEAHRSHGIIGYTGVIQEYDDVIVQKSTGVAFYFNHTLSSNPLIIKNIEFNNYQNLLYCSDRADEDKIIQFLDSQINGNYNQIHNITNNIIQIAYTFNPIFVNYLHIPYVNTQIDIIDELGNNIFSGLTDENGKINISLIVKTIEDNIETYSSTIFNIRLTKNDLFVDYIYKHDFNSWIEKPIYLRDPIEEPLSTPINPQPEPGDPGFEIVIAPDADIALYSCEHTHEDMEKQKEYIYSKIPEEDKPVSVYTDRARHAYDKRPSYDNLIKRALRGEIRKIYTFEEETFGPTRSGITIDLLILAGIEVVYTAT